MSSYTSSSLSTSTRAGPWGIVLSSQARQRAKSACEGPLRSNLGNLAPGHWSPSGSPVLCLPIPLLEVQHLYLGTPPYCHSCPAVPGIPDHPPELCRSTHRLVPTVYKAEGASLTFPLADCIHMSNHPSWHWHGREQAALEDSSCL